MNLEQLEAEALRLDPEARARLAERLIESLGTFASAENERLWIDEARARDEEIETGAVMPQPAEEVFREARSRLG